MKIKVLYEDSNILAIDKPSGISVHPAVEQAHYGAGSKSKKKESFITDWVLENYPKMKNVGEPMGDIARPGIVHRLDRDTSGVLLLAKNQKAHEFLKKQFQGRTIKKTYVAIVAGWFKDERGVINKPIGRSPSDFRRWLCGRGARGELREAVTEYKVLKRFIDKKEKYTYLEVRPKTGRTHQIRVHMKFLNHPVIGDSLYNPGGAIPLPSLPLTKGEEKGGGRMFLHAKQIEFKNLKGETIKVESPLPAQFKKVVK
jgi:23S rRNA pseudouridine1911/1915/1917 synthase